MKAYVKARTEKLESVMNMEEYKPAEAEATATALRPAGSETMSSLRQTALNGNSGARRPLVAGSAHESDCCHSCHHVRF